MSVFLLASSDVECVVIMVNGKFLCIVEQNFRLHTYNASGRLLIFFCGFLLRKQFICLHHQTVMLKVLVHNTLRVCWCEPCVCVLASWATQTAEMQGKWEVTSHCSFQLLAFFLQTACSGGILLCNVLPYICLNNKIATNCMEIKTNSLLSLFFFFIIRAIVILSKLSPAMTIC